MNRDPIIVIALALIVFFLIIGIYIRFFYIPNQVYYISMNVYTNNTTFYQYQMARFKIYLENYGDNPISKLYLGVYVNDNITELYNITLPAHSNTTFYFNNSFNLPGSYSFEFVIDPQHLFNIPNRSNVTKIINISVMPIQRPDPYSIIKPKYYFIENGSLNAFAIYALYSLNKSYGIYFNISYSPELEKVLQGILLVALPYLRNISFSTALYNNTNYSIISSIWLSGYIKKSLIDSVLIGLGYKITNETNLSFVKFNNSSMCYNYSGGWIKLWYVKNGNCTDIRKVNNVTFNVNGPYININNTKYLGSFSYSNYSHSSIYIVNSSLDIITNTTYLGNLICYGYISNIDNRSYCSTYILPTNKSLNSSIRLIQTKMITNKYNYSVYTLFNSSLDIFEQVNDNINILSHLYNKSSLSFISGITNNCELASPLRCSNVTFSNSTLSISITNKSIFIKRAACYINPSYNYTKENITVMPHKSASISITCFNSGSKIVGFPFSLNLKMILSYTYNNTNATSIGSAFIV